MKEKFIELLTSLNIDGMQDLIAYLEEKGFFEDPASTKYHGNFKEGLLQHSMAVYEELVKLTGESNRAVIITSLLHDVCKAGTYGVEMRNVKNETGIWEKVPYYVHKNDGLPYGHGEKSVLIISQFIKLTFEEMLAIRWHMGAYETRGDFNTDLQDAIRMYPLVLYLHTADVIASIIRGV